MPKSLNAVENQRRARARRETALSRAEFRYPSSPREAPASPTSFPVKKIDSEMQRLISEALERKRLGQA